MMAIYIKRHQPRARNVLQSPAMKPRPAGIPIAQPVLG